MPLTAAACYDLLRRHYTACYDRTVPHLREDMEARWLHTEGVVSICGEILSKLPRQGRLLAHPELLEAAAILHDVAKYDNKDEHHKLAESVLLENRSLLGADDGELETLGSIIRAHKGKFNPDEDCACDAAILRMADKIDMLREGKDKQGKFDRGIEKISKYFDKHFQDDPKRVQFLSDFLEVVRALPKEPL